MPGKSYSLDNKSSNRSVNNKPSVINYYGATNIGPVGPAIPGLPSSSPLLGTGVNIKNRSITDRLIEGASTRASTGFLGPKANVSIPEFAILTTGGGVQTAVQVGSKPNAGTKDSPKPTKLTTNTETQELPPGNPNEYDWNLPPHKWSLPTSPRVVNAEHYNDNRFTPKAESSDKYRRGRLWWKANPQISTVDSNGVVNQLSKGDANRKYGFQFLWNPESFGTQVSVQLDATPSVQDRWLGAAGFFPATEVISFTVRIDRTNDFACAASLLPQLDQVERRVGVAPNVILATEVEKFKKFYTPKNSFAAADSSEKMNKKLIDLFQRGTIADLEYLYRAINGPGPGGAAVTNKWLNGRGIETADIGWLMPTLLHVDIGPLAYNGYVTSLQVNHIAFTPNMTPIRTDVTVSLNLLATSSLTTYEDVGVPRRSAGPLRAE